MTTCIVPPRPREDHVSPGPALAVFWKAVREVNTRFRCHGSLQAMMWCRVCHDRLAAGLRPA